MEIVIRPARIGDYDAVMTLWKEAGLPLKPLGRDARGRIEAQLAEPNIIFLVAEAGGSIIGTVVATHDGRKGWINRLAVREDMRGRGLGERLVREAEARLEDVGMDVLACLIEEGNEASMRLFARLGYERKDDIHYFVKKKTPDS
jgi:ribosomal protein S18 acetylase RimI-like enzyme